MKRFTLVMFAALVCLFLASCSEDGSAQKEKSPETAAKNTSAHDPVGEDANTDTDATYNVSSMRKIADAMAATGLFGDSMELHVTGDEYAADILEFTYGINAKERNITDYIISEQSSKQAYSFALVVFGDGSTQEDTEAVEKTFREVYLAELKSALEVYNPEAYAMCDDALIRECQLSDGDSGAGELNGL